MTLCTWLSSFVSFTVRPEVVGGVCLFKKSVLCVHCESPFPEGPPALERPAALEMGRVSGCLYSGRGIPRPCVLATYIHFLRYFCVL